MHGITRPRVAVITAMGLAAPGALEPESFWEIIRTGRTVIGKIRRLDTSESGCSFGGEVPPFDLSLFPAELRPKRVARHTQLLLWAARQIKDEVKQLGQRPSIRLGVATSCTSMISESGIARSQKGGSAASPVRGFAKSTSCRCGSNRAIPGKFGRCINRFHGLRRRIGSHWASCSRYRHRCNRSGDRRGS